MIVNFLEKITYNFKVSFNLLTKFFSSTFFQESSVFSYFPVKVSLEEKWLPTPTFDTQQRVGVLV